MPSKSNDLFSLPIGPEELCFDKNEFIKKSFSVDEFLHEHRNAAGLEEMRDDLGLYLKVLRSAMIELINEDYVDFVNLASNLVGLDQSIDGIQLSLVQLKDEILMIKQMLTDTMHELSDCLAEKLLHKQQLQAMHCVRRVHRAIANLDKLLTPQQHDDNTATTPINSVILERSALEIVQLQFNMQFCGDILAGKHAEKVTVLHGSLMAQIQRHFLAAFDGDNGDALELCLRIYCTLNECRATEELVRINIVAPYMQTVISETALQNCPAGLHGIYRQILHFIATKLQTLLKLSRATGDFDFLLNSCWSEIERRLETQMSSIFAPGNPDLFYQKYQHTMDFLAQLERMISETNPVERWRTHPQYVSFQTRWNLPVYFQIRFQEIGGELESICSKPITSKLLIAGNDNTFKLTPFAVAWQCIQKCWSSGVYLSEIFVRFWTLTLQLIARIGTWLDDCLRQDDLEDKIEFLVALHIDAQHLADSLAQLLVEIVAKSPVRVQQQPQLLQRCFDESTLKLRTKLQLVEQYIAEEILKKSLPNIRQVSDIPRLYRKTNKDVPTKPCVYVEQMLETPKRFHQTYARQWDDERMVSFLMKVFNAINVKYYTAVDDVLTSVQKTEESLRRLKNLREKSATLTASMSGERLTAGGMSDDDKIRLQLHVDTVYWTNEIESLHVQRNAIDKLPELIQLVEDSTKIRIASSK